MEENSLLRGCSARASLPEGVAGLLLCVVFVGGFLTALAADDGAPNPQPAKLQISGYGLFGNRDLKHLLGLLDPKDTKREFYDSNFIEDALLMLMSRLNRDGYLKSQIAARLNLVDGETVSYVWERPLEEPLPRRLRVRMVR